MMAIPKMRTLLVAATIMATFAPVPLNAMSLQDALVSAYSTNPQLAAAQAQQRKTDEGVPQALAAGRPTVQAQAGVGATNGAAAAGSHSSANGSETESRVGPVGAVSVSVPLWTAGRVDAALSGARSRIAAGNATLQVSEQDVLLRTATAYVDVLRAEKVLDVEHQHETELAAELASTKRRQAAGELRAADVEATEARTPRRRPGAPRPRAISTPPARSFAASLVWNRRTCRHRACHPGCRAHGTRRLPRLPTIHRSGLPMRWWPGLAVRSTARRPSSGRVSRRRPAWAFPIRPARSCSTVPLFDGGLAESQSRGAKQELQQRRQELDAQRNAVRQDAVTSWQALTTARAAIEADRTQVTASRAARDGLRREQAQGLRTQLEVLDADQRLLDAEVALVGAQRDVVVAAYRVLAAAGRLTADDLGSTGAALRSGALCRGDGCPALGSPRGRPSLFRSVEELIVGLSAAG